MISGTPASARRVHILLIEDNPGDVYLVRQALRENGTTHDLSVVTGGQEAIDFMYRIGNFAEAPRPDLILLDLNLPGISGLDVLSHLKSNLEFQNIPIIVLSSSRSPLDVWKSYELAANCYVCKPPTLDEFMHTIRTLQEFWVGLVKLPTLEREQAPFRRSETLPRMRSTFPAAAG